VQVKEARLSTGGLLSSDIDSLIIIPPANYVQDLCHSFFAHQ
jgi:hypothetical protein